MTAGWERGKVEGGREEGDCMGHDTSVANIVFESYCTSPTELPKVTMSMPSLVHISIFRCQARIVLDSLRKALVRKLKCHRLCKQGRQPYSSQGQTCRPGIAV